MRNDLFEIPFVILAFLVLFCGGFVLGGSAFLDSTVREGLIERKGEIWLVTKAKAVPNE